MMSQFKFRFHNKTDFAQGKRINEAGLGDSEGVERNNQMQLSEAFLSHNYDTFNVMCGLEQDGSNTLQ